jgi:hypothetical protein
VEISIHKGRTTVELLNHRQRVRLTKINTKINQQKERNLNLLLHPTFSKPLSVHSPVNGFNQLYEKHITEQNRDEEAIERRMRPLHLKRICDRRDIRDCDADDTNENQCGSKDFRWARLNERNMLCA